MQVTVKMSDGTAQVLDAESISLTVGGSPVGLYLMGTPEMLCLSSLNDEKDSYQFVHYPTATNSILLQLRRSDTYKDPSSR